VPVPHDTQTICVPSGIQLSHRIAIRIEKTRWLGSKTATIDWAGEQRRTSPSHGRTRNAHTTSLDFSGISFLLSQLFNALRLQPPSVHPTNTLIPWRSPSFCSFSMGPKLLLCALRLFSSSWTNSRYPSWYYAVRLGPDVGHGGCGTPKGGISHEARIGKSLGVKWKPKASQGVEFWSRWCQPATNCPMPKFDHSDEVAVQLPD
jgi:hypothetical protein